MHHLEIPFEFAGECIYSHQRCAEEIGAGPVAAPIVSGGLPEWHVEYSALGVDGEHAPYVGAGAVLPVVAFPGVAPGLTGTGNGMKRPEEFAATRIPRPRIALRADAGP